MKYSLFSDSNGKPLSTKDMSLTPSGIKELEIKTDFKKNIMKKYTKLSVFDFDGTLVDTGHPDTHKPIWKEKTNTDWPHVGWWGRKESLDMNVFDFNTNPEVIADYEIESSNEDTMVIVLTGRRATSSKKAGLEKEVKAVLDSFGLEFDRYLLNYGGDTCPNKMEQIVKLLHEFPSITELELWDDRDEHIPTFDQWGNGLVDKNRIDSYKMNHVFNAHWTK